MQQDALGGSYDHAFACFGMMFFMIPGAAMPKIRKSLKPEGRWSEFGNHRSDILDAGVEEVQTLRSHEVRCRRSKRDPLL